MKAYIIAHIETKNLENMEKYREKVFDIVVNYGGKYFYESEEYKPLLKLRMKSGISSSVLVKGI